jgi:hypothetical protein
LASPSGPAPSGIWTKTSKQGCRGWRCSPPTTEREERRCSATSSVRRVGPHTRCHLRRQASFDGGYRIAIAGS